MGSHSAPTVLAVVSRSWRRFPATYRPRLHSRFADCHTTAPAALIESGVLLWSCAGASPLKPSNLGEVRGERGHAARITQQRRALRQGLRSRGLASTDDRARLSWSEAGAAVRAVRRCR